MAINKDICFVCGNKLENIWAHIFQCKDDSHEFRYSHDLYIDIYYNNITCAARPATGDFVYVYTENYKHFRSNGQIIMIPHNTIIFLKTEDKILEHIRNIQLMD